MSIERNLSIAFGALLLAFGTAQVSQAAGIGGSKGAFFSLGASYNGTTKTFTVTVDPPAVQSFSSIALVPSDSNRALLTGVSFVGPYSGSTTTTPTGVVVASGSAGANPPSPGDVDIFTATYFDKEPLLPLSELTFTVQGGSLTDTDGNTYFPDPVTASATVPEPSSLFGLSAFGVIGAGYLLKCQYKKAKV